MCCRVRGPFHSFARGDPLRPAPFLGKTILSLLESSQDPCWKSVDHKREDFALNSQFCSVDLDVSPQNSFSKSREWRQWAVTLLTLRRRSEDGETSAVLSLWMLCHISLEWDLGHVIPLQLLFLPVFFFFKLTLLILLISFPASCVSQRGRKRQQDPRMTWHKRAHTHTCTHTPAHRRGLLNFL